MLKNNPVMKKLVETGEERIGKLAQQLLSNEHSPGMFRAIGAPRNQSEWYDSFGIKDGKYYLPPEKRLYRGDHLLLVVRHRISFVDSVPAFGLFRRA